jgi:GNAT superfamily N-acetyltransferase
MQGHAETPLDCGIHGFAGKDRVSMMKALSAYAAWEELGDGRPVLIRAIRRGDGGALQGLVRRLSPESAYLRFFQAKRELSPDELRYYAEVDFRTHVALVAVVQEEGADLLIGTGRYFTEGGAASGTAELSFLVDEAHQGLGTATHLLRHLAGIARTRGISGFRAGIIADNQKMLDVFSRSGLPMEIAPSGGMTEVRLKLID